MKTIQTSVKNLANLIPTMNVNKVTVNRVSEGKVFLDCFGNTHYGDNRYYIHTPIITLDFANRFIMRYEKVLGFETDKMYFED